MPSETTLSWGGDESWGSKFWVTLVDPRTNVEFFACPGTGAVSWDPPEGHFVLPPSEEGEWWELSSDSHGGLSYYYHTKTKETVWERPDGFIIPLGVLQGTSLVRQGSTSKSAPAGKNVRKSVSLERAGSLGRAQGTRQTASSGPSSYSSPENGNGNGTRRAQLSIAPALGTIPGSTSDLALDAQQNVKPGATMIGGSLGRNSRSQRRNPNNLNPNSPLGQQQQKHTPKHLPLPTSLDAAAVMITGGSGSNPNSPRSPAFQQQMDYFKTPGSPSLTPPKDPYSVGGGGSSTASGYNQNQNYSFRGTSAEMVRPPRRSTSAIQRSASPLGYGYESATSQLQALKLAPHKSQPDLHAGLMRGSRGGGYTDLNGRLSPPGINGGPATTTTVKMGGRQITISAPLLQRRGTDGDITLDERNQKLAPDSVSLRGMPPIISPPSSPPPFSSNWSKPWDASNASNSRSGQPASPGILRGIPAPGPASPGIPTSPQTTTTSTSPIPTSPSFTYHAHFNSTFNPPSPSPLSANATTSFNTSSVFPSPGQNNNSNSNHSSSGRFNPNPTASNFNTSTAAVPPLRPALRQAQIHPHPHPHPHPHAHAHHQPHRSIPQTLATEISQFASTEFARTYFATHRRGIIWRRKIPVEEMMVWSKAPLSSPLLQLPRTLQKDAVRAFKAIQLVMGDRDLPNNMPVLRSTASQTTLGLGGSSHGHGYANIPRAILEEERWLLSQGILHGEMRDEMYCQMVKQLNGCPSLESTFKGWQLLCVLLVTFPPSKNLEDYLRRFILDRCGAAHSKGRINILAKYALNRLLVISRKGPRGKPPTLSEIASASDAPFNPSIFGEPLDSIMRLQSRTSYADLKVPIVLPFLADGILALGGMQSEGIFRVQGDAESLAEMKSKIDRGFYTLDGSGDGVICEDPNILAGLLKLWLRELQDPLIPDEMYGDCVQAAARFRTQDENASTSAGVVASGEAILNSYMGVSDPNTHQAKPSMTSVDREKERVTRKAREDAQEQELLSIVSRLPTINRRVVLFVISFLQLFLDEKVIKATKMTAANLALVMAPNLLRCRSDSMRVVFTNAQYEHIFVHHLLINLKCDKVDPDYIATHGMGARSGLGKRT